MKNKDINFKSSFWLKNFLVDVRGQCLKENRNGSTTPIVLKKQLMDVLVYLSMHHRTPVSIAEIEQQVFKHDKIEPGEVGRMLHKLITHFGPAQQLIQVLDRNTYMLTADPLPLEGVRPQPQKSTVYHHADFDRKRIFGLVFAILIVIAFVVVAQLLKQPPGNTTLPPSTQVINASKPLVVVLPFDNKTQHQSKEYLGFGLSTALRDTLASDDAHHIIAGHSAYTYNQKYANAIQIGALLGTDYVIRGNLEKDKNNLTVTVELLSTEHDKKLWSNTYHSAFDKLAGLHQTISQDVTRQLNRYNNKSSVINAITSVDSSVFNDYLKALQYLKQKTPTANQAAQTLLQNALDSAPAFHKARLALVKTLLQQLQLNRPFSPQLIEQITDLMLSFPAAMTAEAAQIQGQLALHQGELEKAKNHFIRATKQQENLSHAHLQLGLVYQQLNRFNDAHQSFSKAYRLNPSSDEVNRYFGRNLLYQGELEKGMEHLTRSIKAEVQHVDIEVEMANWYHKYGFNDKTIQWATVAQAKAPKSVKAQLAQVLGHNDKQAAKVLANTIRNNQHNAEDALFDEFYTLANLHYRQGDQKALADLLESATNTDLNASVTLYNGLWQLQQNRFDSAFEAFKSLVVQPLPKHWPLATELMLYNSLAFSAEQLGNTAAKEDYLNQAKDIQNQWLEAGLRTPMFVTQMTAYLILTGQQNKARQLLKNATAKRWRLDVYTQNNPIFALLNR